MLAEAMRERTLWSPVVFLAAAVTLWAGCRSPSPRASRRAEAAVVLGQEPAHRRFALREGPPEQVVGILSQLGTGTAAVVPECNAVDVAATDPEPSEVQVVVDLPDAGTAPDPDVHPPVEPRGPARASASSREGANDGSAEVPSLPCVRVIPPALPAPAPTRPVEETVSGPPPQTATSAGPGHGTSGPAMQGCPPRDAEVPVGSGPPVDLDKFEPAALANAGQVLRLDLPEQLDLIQLLDLAGEYLQLDYLYDPEKIRGQVVTLKLHGKLQGQLQVRDLYLLLESVLKFKGFAMTRHQGNLVTIVPAADALKANPDLLDPQHRAIEAGDMVVTDLFDLRHVSVSAASTLLQNMQLSLAVTPVEGSRALIVTCYAHQIERIERLLRLVDRPGAPRAFRFRPLRYTLADALTRKIEVLLPQLGGLSVTVGATAAFVPRPGGPAARIGKPLATGGPTAAQDNVYLDADARTNRILMIGPADQLAVVDRLVDSLDVAQQDLRILKIYPVQHVEAQGVKKKLEELEVLSAGLGAPTVAAGPAGKIADAQGGPSGVAARPVVVVLEATNSLVINASEEQHARVQALLAYLDAAVRTETIPYEIYFLENQDPENVAQVLEKIVHETVADQEGKLRRILRDAAEQIVIVPDQNTFSLIVYASRKNQEWIRKLIETLDRRRPQVLIDVALVEIRKTDEFNYDLGLITSVPDLVQTGGQTGQFYIDQNTTVVEKLLQTHRSQFLDFELDSGAGTGFYADRHINALLKVVQAKNYGRVLAKPKVLVNDNEKGTIKTADTTYVVTKSAIPVTAGTAGAQNTLIETAVKYEPYDAGITLEITPHISEQVLRLEINLNRSDFTSVTAEKPPDETSSDISTIVTVPDRSTIILGGMLRLNQTKSGRKVPILGDLPLVGGVFRSISNNDIQSKLYIFVRAEVIRPTDTAKPGGSDIDIISRENREAFEEHEREFQNYQDWPGIKAKPVEPRTILEAR